MGKTECIDYLSGKFRFVSQIIIIWRLIFEGIIVFSSEISSMVLIGCSSGFIIVSSYGPISHKLFLEPCFLRLCLISLVF